MPTKIKPRNDGVTPLSIAAELGHPDVVRHLVEVGAQCQIDREPGTGELAPYAHCPSQHELGHLEVVRHLVEVGALR